MEINGAQNNPLNVNDVLDDVNTGAGQANDAATEAQQNISSRLFFSILQRLLSTAQENSSSGA